MTSNLLGTTVDEVLESVLSTEPEALFVVNPGVDAVEQLVDVANDFGSDLPSIRLLGDQGLLKDVMGDFIVASNTANLVESGALEIRVLEDDTRSSMLVTDDEAVALLEAGGLVGGLATDDAEFTGTAYDAVSEDWEGADEFNLRTPAIDRVSESLDAEIGPEVEDDFETVLESMETARGDGEGLDEVTISLLVAAKNRVLLYDISKWGEDVGIASKATFSRTKTKLEDLGLIDTEKVPIDVGRPRLRLKLADERLEDAPPSELANTAQSVLS
jgi:hypothetical protein